jgi:hypothetical protein
VCPFSVFLPPTTARCGLVEAFASVARRRAGRFAISPPDLRSRLPVCRRSRTTRSRSTHNGSSSSRRRSAFAPTRCFREARIELGRRAPSIDLLLRICLRFRRPIEYFLAATFAERPFSFVQRAADIGYLSVRTRRRLVDRGWAETQFRSLASGFGPRGMYPYYAKLR